MSRRPRAIRGRARIDLIRPLANLPGILGSGRHGEIPTQSREVLAPEIFIGHFSSDPLWRRTSFRLGTLCRVRPAVAVSVRRDAAGKSSADLREPRDGGGPLRHPVSRGRRCAEARMVAGGGGPRREDLLGPIGLFVLLCQGAWPLATIVLCFTNDLIWWIPFALYLRGGVIGNRVVSRGIPTGSFLSRGLGSAIQDLILLDHRLHAFAAR